MTAGFYDLFDKPTPPPGGDGPTVAPGQANGYANVALEAEAIKVATAINGTRNDTLNTAAYNLGQLVGGGHLIEAEVVDALTDAAHRVGLEDDEIEATLRSGLKAGQTQPRHVPERDTTPPKVTVIDPPPPEEVDAFWDSRPELRGIREFARARMCSPWAVLGCVLARVVTAVPPFVTLPALVGSEASLNLFIALVGPSGTGKGAAEAAAADAIHVGHVEVAHVGSGEGIAHLYAHREKGEVIRDRDAVLFTVPEVDNITALSGRQGSTLLPQLRMAWSGERLGFAYVDKTKNLPIDRHSYRLGLLLGVQPGRAAPLLEDTDGGTPQRFLWMPTTDPDAPDTPPAEPDPYDWPGPGRGQWIANIRGLSPLPVPDTARRTILSARRDRLRGEDTDTLDGHAGLARLKAAAALALLAGRREIDDFDWDLAGTLMGVSDATRAGVGAYLASKARMANAARGEAEADRAVVVTEKLDAAQVTRVCKVITRALHRADTAAWMTRRDVVKLVASRDRDIVDDALGRLIQAGQIETRDDNGKPLYRLSEGV